MPTGHAIVLWCSLLAAALAAFPSFSNARGEMETLAQDNAAFALDLYDHLRTDEGNLFFSPHGISTALAMTYAGAREETRAQMQAALRFSLEGTALHKAFSALDTRLNALQDSGDVELLAANSLWPQEGALLDAYLSLIETHYDAVVEPVDYTEASSRKRARKRINAWVEQKTREKIRDLVPKGVLDALTRLVLVNAIYFKGSWTLPFDETATSEAPFHTTPDSRVAVPMMHRKETFRYGEIGGRLQLLELPYGNGDLSMLIVLPETIDGCGGVEAGLDPDALSNWRKRLRRKKVEVYLPRFKISDGFRLDKILRNMGMTDAFDPQKADFAGMDGRPDRLYITAAIHKAYVDVNEKGTEAAAATAVMVGGKALMPPEPPPVFRADHPFLFLIQENKTGAVLFMGRVADPTAEAK